MIRRSVGLVPLLLAASAAPVFAQSHAGHGAAANAVQPSVQLPAGCVRRGAPTPTGRLPLARARRLSLDCS